MAKSPEQPAPETPAAEAPKPRFKPHRPTRAPHRRPPGSPDATVIDPNAPPPYAVGDRVSHPTFGEGNILRMDGSKLMVAFGDMDRKVLDTFVTRV